MEKFIKILTAVTFLTVQEFYMNCPSATIQKKSTVILSNSQPGCVSASTAMADSDARMFNITLPVKKAKSQQNPAQNTDKEQRRIKSEKQLKIWQLCMSQQELSED